jgi:tRNA(fMet)-specific endonuclease VapC
MPLFLLDTDHLTLYEYAHPLVVSRVALQPRHAVGVSDVTVEEALRGRLAALAKARDGAARIARYARLRGTVQLFQHFPIAPFDQAAESRFQQLLASRLRVGTRDLKIAAVALANGLTLLTRNRRDFGRVPGLTLDNWSV